MAPVIYAIWISRSVFVYARYYHSSCSLYRRENFVSTTAVKCEIDTLHCFKLRIPLWEFSFVKKKHFSLSRDLFTGNMLHYSLFLAVRTAFFGLKAIVFKVWIKHRPQMELARIFKAHFGRFFDDALPSFHLHMCGTAVVFSKGSCFKGRCCAFFAFVHFIRSSSNALT